MVQFKKLTAAISRGYMKNYVNEGHLIRDTYRLPAHGMTFIWRLFDVTVTLARSIHIVINNVMLISA